MTSSRRYLTDKEALALYHFLLENTTHKVLRRGAAKEAAIKFGVSEDTVRRIRRRAESATTPTEVIDALRKKYAGNVGRPKTSAELPLNKIKSVQISRRGTIRSAAHAMSVSKSTLHRAITRGDIWRYRDDVKPILTMKNKQDRVRFALMHIDRRFHTLPYVQMENIVHVDEKWFFLTKVSRSVICAPGELPPLRKVHSKRHITKVMFLAAIAKPRFDFHRKRQFDGKIGMFPFIKSVPAQRNLRNCPKGTVESKPINVDRELYRRCLLDQVIPAIKEVWPDGRRGSIIIQQDNAKPHLIENDSAILEAGSADG